MRFSLASVGDLEVTPGTTLAECRPALDALLGPAAGARLYVGRHELADHHVAGLPPWVAGSHVTIGAPDADGPDGADADAPEAARALWHLAVVVGPDAGAVAAAGRDGRLAVGRAPGTDRLVLTDPAVSRTHAMLAGRRRVVVRDAGSANATWTRRDRGRATPWSRRRVPRWRRVRRSRRLRPGDRLRMGATELELRREVVAPPPLPRDEATEAAPRAAPPADPGARAGRVAAMVVPVLLGLTMAAVTGSPVLLLMALAGPVVTGAPMLVGLASRRARRRAPGGRRGIRAQPAPDLGPDAAALSALLARGETAPPAWWPLAGEGLVVTGPDDARHAAARVLAAAALADPAVTLTLLPPGASDAADGWADAWRWARWLAGDPDGDAPARVVVADGAGLEPVGRRRLVVAQAPWPADLDRWWLAADRGDAGTRRTDSTDAPDDPDAPGGARAAVVLVPPGAPQPPWCRWVLTVREDGRAVLRGPAGTHEVPALAASAAWAERHARLLAGRARADVAATLPDRVAPADVGLPDDVDGVVRAWSGAGRRRSGLGVPVGVAVGPRGPEPAWLDLTRDGPHALVAGTTGAGKSELLQALVLGLALRHPPDELAVVLLDFKGGAGLRSCAGLPHVVGRVSDLDPEEAVRALEALSAELRRREELLAAAGVSDLAQLRAAATGAPVPPRLLVVVDEFRALAEDLPDFVPGLVRLAAQGRSLGMHLVLATQRPAGAVTAQMRANLALRVCLRVTDPGESQDVVDAPDAAALPARTPGRALVRRADGAPQVVQTTWVALQGHRRAPVRPARPWGAARRTAGEEVPAPDAAERLTDAARAAATRLGLTRPAPLWSPRLPDVVGPDELAAVTGAAGRTGASPGLLLGVTDPPGGAPRGALAWDASGLLVVAGGAGSGRTTAALRAVHAALGAGRHVHVVGPAGRRAPAGHPCLGTVVDAADARRLARLLTLLDAGPVAEGTLLVVDDVAAAIAALDRMPRGTGTDLLDRLARDARRRGLGVVVTGHPRDVVRLAPLATARLVLPVADPGDDAVLGVPRDLSRRHAPGRAVLVTGGTAVRCHVALPGALDDAAPAAGFGEPAPLRLRALPDRVTRSDLGRHRGPAAGVPVGLGGDDAAPVAVDVSRGALVVGPPGSGRSTALATLAAGLARTGARVGVVARGGPLAEVADALGLVRAEAAHEVESLLPRAGAGPTAPVGAPPSAATPATATPTTATSGKTCVDALVVDDLDALARARPDLDDRVADLVLARERGEPAPAVVAACRTDRAASAYRGGVAALRGTAPVVVLVPSEAGSAEVAGADLSAACDPALPRHPGRGAVVRGGVAVPVQVALPS